MPLYVTGDEEVDGLVNTDPFALLVAMVLDQQVPMERAFSAPAALRARLGGELDPAAVAAMDPAALAAAVQAHPALHRFPAAMAARVQELAHLVVRDWGGDASAIWRSARSGDELATRLASLPGFGEQKARILVALLAQRFDVRPPGWRAAAAPYGEPDAFASVADVDSPEALARVRARKRELKAAARRPGTRAPAR